MSTGYDAATKTFSIEFDDLVDVCQQFARLGRESGRRRANVIALPDRTLSLEEYVEFCIQRMADEGGWRERR